MKLNARCGHDVNDKKGWIQAAYTHWILASARRGTQLKCLIYFHKESSWRSAVHFHQLNNKPESRNVIKGRIVSTIRCSMTSITIIFAVAQTRQLGRNGACCGSISQREGTDNPCRHPGAFTDKQKAQQTYRSLDRSPPPLSGLSGTRWAGTG